MRDRLGTGLVIALCSLGVAACGGGERQDEDEPSGEFPVQIVSATFPAKQRLAQTSDLKLAVRNTGDETIPDLAVTIFTDPDSEVEVQAEGTESETEGQQEPSTEGDTGGEGGEEELSEEVEQELKEELEEQEGEQTTVEGGEGEDEPDVTVEEEALPQSAGPFSVRSQHPDLAVPSRPVWILEQGYPKLAGETATAGAESAQTNTFSFGPLERNETMEAVWRVTPVQAGTYTVRYVIAAGLHGKAVAVTADGSEPEGEFVVRITDVPPQTRVNDAGEVVPIKPGDIVGEAGTKKQRGELGGSQSP